MTKRIDTDLVEEDEEEEEDEDDQSVVNYVDDPYSLKCSQTFSEMRDSVLTNSRNEDDMTQSKTFSDASDVDASLEEMDDKMNLPPPLPKHLHRLNDNEYNNTPIKNGIIKTPSKLAANGNLLRPKKLMPNGLHLSSGTTSGTLPGQLSVMTSSNDSQCPHHPPGDPTLSLSHSSPRSCCSTPSPRYSLAGKLGDAQPSTSPPSPTPNRTRSLPPPPSKPYLYRSYKMRWVIIGVISLLNFTNAISWISYAPVANHTDRFYGRHAANWLSMIFLVAAIPMAFVAMWSSSRYGIKLAILYAAWSNSVGACFRMLSSYTEFDQGIRFVIVIIGQCFSASAYPFIMFLPTKVAAAWFPDHQRALASTIGTMSNALGVLIANLVVPQMVHSPQQVYLINIYTLVPSLAVCIAATLCITRSEPRTPPTRSAAQTNLPFWPGLKRLLKSRSYVLLMVCLGCGIGMFNALYTMMQQILCSKGYTNEFSGLCSALIIVGGVIGAILSGIFVDKTKLFEETIKIGLGIAALGGIGYAEAALFPNLQVLIALICASLGFFGMGCYPVGLELSAEVSHPVAPTTAAGMVILMGQIQGVMFIAIMQSLATQARPEDLALETCSNGNLLIVSENSASVGGKFTNFTLNGVNSEDSEYLPVDSSQPMNAMVPLMVFAGTGVFIISSFILFFKPKYRRVKLDKPDPESQKLLRVNSNVCRGRSPKEDVELGLRIEEKAKEAMNESYC